MIIIVVIVFDLEFGCASGFAYDLLVQGRVRAILEKDVHMLTSLMTRCNEPLAMQITVMAREGRANEDKVAEGHNRQVIATAALVVTIKHKGEMSGPGSCQECRGRH